MKPKRKSIAALLREGGELMDKFDNITAAARFKEAADRGSAEGAYWLGMLYEMVPDDFVHDDAVAARYYHQAAAKGHAEAMMHLAMYYEYGTGVKQNRELADMYWQAAAKAGLPEAKVFYADFLFFNADEAGRKRNVKNAKRWLKSAMKHPGHAADASIALRHIAEWERTGVLPECPPIEELFDDDLFEDDAEDR